MTMMILRVPNQNGVSQLYNMLEMYHSGPQPSKFYCLTHQTIILMTYNLMYKVITMIHTDVQNNNNDDLRFDVLDNDDNSQSDVQDTNNDLQCDVQTKPMMIHSVMYKTKG